MATPKQCKVVAVIGNGLIGHGVAQVFAVGGKEVRLIGRRDDSLRIAMGKITANLKAFVSHKLISAPAAQGALKRIRPTTDMTEAAAANLVIEAVPFVHETQLQVFEELDRVCAPPTILATTSGQVASELVQRVKHRERVLAAHFWYPSHLIPAVEVCGTPETTPDVVPWVCKVLEDVGKVPVVLNHEVKGFIGNRLQFALLREAWALWASGAASAEMIDKVVRNTFGRRLDITGPLESADVGGLETMYNFGAWLMPDLDRGPNPATKIGELVKAGHKGPVTGRGVYDWSQRDSKQLLAARMDELFRWLTLDKKEASKNKAAKKKIYKSSSSKRRPAKRVKKRTKR